MKHYVYRFMTGEHSNNISYVGETKDIDRRMKEHFSKNGSNLSDEQYKQVTAVDYIEFHNSVDAKMFEIYYINVIKPSFNTRDKMRDYPNKHKEYEELFDSWDFYEIGNIQEIIQQQIEEEQNHLNYLVEEFEKTNQRLTKLTQELEITNQKMRKIINKLGKEFESQNIYTFPNPKRTTKYITQNGSLTIKKEINSILTI